jgi:hypothetical protein
MGRIVAGLVVVVLLAGGCLGGSHVATGHGPAPPLANLRIDVSYTRGRARDVDIRAVEMVRHYTLTCLPTGGTVPDPGRVCGALIDLRTDGMTGGCPGLMATGRPGSRATVSGTFMGRPYRLVLTADDDWCGRSRHVMHDFWTISTFPCDDAVTHEPGPGGPGASYASWARWAGCPGRPVRPEPAIASTSADASRTSNSVGFTLAPPSGRPTQSAAAILNLVWPVNGVPRRVSSVHAEYARITWPAHDLTSRPVWIYTYHPSSCWPMHGPGGGCTVVEFHTIADAATGALVATYEQNVGRRSSG